MPGKHTNRKIVVFESDDWGSIRMPPVKASNKLLKHGFPVDQDHYNKYNTVAGNIPHSALFDVLTSVKDSQGKYAKFIPLSLVANSDFKKSAITDFKSIFMKHSLGYLCSMGKVMIT